MACDQTTFFSIWSSLIDQRINQRSIVIVLVRGKQSPLCSPSLLSENFWLLKRAYGSPQLLLNSPNCHLEKAEFAAAGAFEEQYQNYSFSTGRLIHMIFPGVSLSQSKVTD